jgi:hypothetical protein
MSTLRSLSWKVPLILAGPLSFACAAFLPFTATFELPDSAVGSPILGWQMASIVPVAGSPFIVRDHPWIVAQVPALFIGVGVVALSPLLLRGPCIFNFACAAFTLPAFLAVISLDDYFVHPRLIGYYLSIVSLILTFAAHIVIGLSKPEPD